MKQQEIQNISRRSFVKNIGLATGGLIIAGYFPACDTADKKRDRNSKDDGVHFQPNLFIQMGSDGYVTFVVARSEMGQGIRTSLAAVLADELDADWDYVSIQQADGDKKYGDQNTDGSHSIRSFYQPMRALAANTKAMLIAAAAAKWNVKAEECSTANHFVLHQQSNQKAFYGDLAEAASKLPVPTTAALKDPKDHKYIGKKIKSLDIRDFTHGTAKYGMDIKLAGMKYAVILRCPVTFGELLDFDAKEAQTIPGVLDVFAMKRVAKPFGPLGGVVVVADNTWAAMNGKKAINANWKNGPNEKYDSELYRKQLFDSFEKSKKETKKKGNVDQAFKNAAKTIEASYYLPHLAHAPMEVPNATADFKDGKCEIWAPVQDPQTSRSEVADYLGIPLENVTIHVTFLGGAFGRKSKPDFVVEAAAISQRIKAPVQLVWTREDDIQHGYYHTVNAQYLKGSLDAQGKVSGWLHKSAFPSIMSTFEPGTAYAADWEMGQGVTSNAFQIPNVTCINGKAPAMVRIGWMRSVLDSPHSFGLNVFADELAHAAGKDPLDFMLALIGDDRQEDHGNSAPFYSKRLKDVLKKAATNAAWGKVLPSGHAQGLAVHYSFQSYVASIAEVSVINNKLKVHKIHTVIDCGTAVNKDAIESQMQGSAVFGISALLYGKITAKDGIIQQSNFHDYPMARMADAPEVFVEIIDNQEEPTGVGEPGLPVIAPAIVNAIFKATGKRYRELPLTELT
ncbi:MAG: molybdopterin cofactor-binding domain-containing protein [Saprospiraceae bacterium]